MGILPRCGLHTTIIAKRVGYHVRFPIAKAVCEDLLSPLGKRSFVVHIRCMGIYSRKTGEG